MLGSSIPILPGITPGSGPGHLGLFGYDPLKYPIGRGALEATGVGFKLGPKDVATRCNFCHPRHGRPYHRSPRRPHSDARKVPRWPSSSARLRSPASRSLSSQSRSTVSASSSAAKASAAAWPTPIRRRRACRRWPPSPRCSQPGTAEIAKEFIAQAQKLLAGQPKANGLTMRGFANAPHLPSYEDVYGLKAAAIAVYPMYKGLAQLVGMDLVGKPSSLSEEIDVLAQAWNDYDFFFVHFKYTDSRGEDGNFAEKVKMIEQFDAIVPRVNALKPTVLAVTGDHSTPAKMKSHSWHPVPVLTPRRNLPHRRLPVVRRDRVSPRAAWGSSRQCISCRCCWRTPIGWRSSGHKFISPAVPRASRRGLYVARLTVVNNQVQALAARQIDGNRLRRRAAADRRTAEFQLSVDEDPKSDAPPTAGRVVDPHIGLEAAPGLIEPIGQPRGAVDTHAFKVQPTAARNSPPVTLRSFW